MMGKRKRSSGRLRQNPNGSNTPSSSDNMLCSSGTDQLSREDNSSTLDDYAGKKLGLGCLGYVDWIRSFHLSELKPVSPGVDVSNSNAKLANVQSSPAQPRYNLGLTSFVKRSRYAYGQRIPQRNSGSDNNSSTYGKTISSNDGRLSFQLTDQSGSDSGCQIENRERPFGGAERIWSSSQVIDAVSSDPVKRVCGICQKLLRRKPYFLGDALLSGECSVVAVLVCGHVYHADCLEQRTSLEGRHDPLCPACLGLLCATDASRGQE